MTRLRKSILLMFINLTVVFNIERLDYNGQDVINIQTFVYVVIATAIFTTLVFHLLQRLSPLLGVFLWMLVYTGLKLFVFTDRPLLGGMYTYLTITEIALLTISVLLAYDLARALGRFEGVIEKVTFPKHGERVLDMKSAQEEVKTEFVRGRRHNRPISVMVLKMDLAASRTSLEQVIQSIQRTMLNRYLLASLAQLLSKEARRTDMIIEQEDHNRFVLLCPETTSEGSAVMAERIQTMAMEELGISITCGVASFPEEALTFEDLLRKASLNMLRPGEPEPLVFPEPHDVPAGQPETHS